MKLIIVADHDPKSTVEFSPAKQTPPLNWTPKRAVRLVKVAYRPGMGAVVHVSTDKAGRI